MQWESESGVGGGGGFGVGVGVEIEIDNIELGGRSLKLHRKEEKSF